MNGLFKWFALLFSIVLIIGCKPKKEPDFIPEWSKGVVWYQIFPERFRNGDTTNDPELSDQKGCWPHELIEPWEVHPWGSDWYALEDYEQSNGKDTWYNITRRRYGGDLQGIIDKLDYLKELGIGAIYLNPVFVAPSHHKYDIAYHHHIDPTFGPGPEKDWKIIRSETPDDPSTWKWTTADSLALRLIREAHKRDMRIIFDGVFNHVGYNNFAIDDLRKNQKDSRFKDWFTIKSWEDSVTGSEFEVKRWWNIKDMPELREDTSGIVEGPKKYIFDITRRWMDPGNNGDVSKGIDGWRLDVADYVAHPFWKDWRKHVKQINPEAYITGEIIESSDYIKPYLQGDEFDAVMNYNFNFICSEFFINDSSGISSTRFATLLKRLRKAFPDQNLMSQQNLIGSHDTPRASSRIVNKNKGSFLDKDYFFGQTKATNPNFDTRKPSIEEYETLKLMTTFQMTYPGSPMIYYGDEVGMWGAHDPCCRKPMIWSDIPYEDESSAPPNASRKGADKVEINKDLLEFYKEIIKIHNDSPALKWGDFKTLLADNKNRVFAFSRIYDDDMVFVMINAGNEEQSIDIQIERDQEFRDMLNIQTEIISNNSKITVKVPPGKAAILRNQN